jgi:hypothetical protein
MRTISGVALLAVVPLVVAALAGCSSPATGGTGAGSCAAYVSTADLSKPVSFKGEVLPIFQASCATGGMSCHVAGSNPTPMQLFLGGAGMTPEMVRGRIVGMASGEDPRMSLVAAGDPAASFLIHKMDNDQCTLASVCNTSTYAAAYPNCGALMPQPVSPATTSDILPLAQRDTVRAWIKQGAQDN